MTADREDVTEEVRGLEEKRAESLAEAQSRVLQLALQDRPLDDALEALVRAVEDQSPHRVLGSILLLDGEHLRHGAAPNLPGAYNEAIDGTAIGPQVGSCGTAAHRKAPVYVSDIDTDPLWEDFRDLALSHGLRACWSTPIVSGGGDVLGTFAMYYGQPRSPTPEDLELVDFVTDSAALIIERKRAEQALRESEERLRIVQAAGGIGSFDYDLQKDTAICSPEYYEMLGLPDGAPITRETWTQAVHPDDRERALESLDRAIADRKPFDYEYRIVRANDGEVRWLSGRAAIIFDSDDRPWRYVGGNIDITDRKRSEQRRAALVELGDRFRDLDDPADIAFAAAEILGRTLEVSRAGYGTINSAAETIRIERDWNAPGIETLAGVLHFRDYGSYIEDLKRGETVVFADAEKDPRTAANADALKAISAQAIVNMPVTEQGGFVALLYLNHASPREWTTEELEFIRDVADRTRTAVERRRVEQELSETERRLRAAVIASPFPMMLHAEDGEVLELSRKWTELTGYRREQIGTHFDWLRLAFRSRAENFAALLAKEFEDEGESAAGEWEIVTADGSTRLWDFHNVRLGELPDGRRLQISAASDVTDARASEQALRDSEARFRSVFENAGIGFLEVDDDWRIIGANNAYAQIAGRPAEELLGSDSLSFTHPEDLTRSKKAMRSLADGQTQNVSFEKRYIHPDGQTIWVRSNLTRVSSGPAGNRYLKIVEDIDARKTVEEALREERYRLEKLNQVWAAVSADLDLEAIVQKATDAGVELSGAEFGAFFYNVVNPAGESYMLYTLSGADRSAFERFGMPRNTKVFGPTFAGDGVVRSDDITKDPRYGKNPPHNGMPKGHLPVRSYLAVPVMGRSGEVIGGLFFGHSETGRFNDSHERLLTGIAAQAAIAIDNARLYQAVQRANETLEQRVEQRTGELERANEALRQAQKMEAIGQLTGGIAHDFNNMLTVIRGSADVLRRPDLADDRRERYLQAISDTSDRAARLTAQLLAFARRQTLKPEVFDAAERVESISEMLHTLLGSRIQLQIDRGADDCLVETDAAQFETALVNMAVNGRDAMDGEGSLRVSVACAAELPPQFAQQSDRLYVALSVSDSGHGIAPDDLDKIFEPFFTTKETGKGTGLGLSQVYGFAKQSGGEVLVESEVGRGTTFTLYLPRAPEGRAPGDSAVDRNIELRRGGRVLVVEDNGEVGVFAEQVLGELGFEAKLASNGAEALDMLEEDSGFDVVFSDVVMAGIGGIDLARMIRERWPHLPVVLTSGYSHVLASGVDHSFPLLHKPYSLESLAKVLGTALAGRDATRTEEK